MHEQSHKLRVGIDFMCTNWSQEKGLEMSPIRKNFIYHSQIYFYVPAWLIWFNNNNNNNNNNNSLSIYMHLIGFRNSAAYTSAVFPTFRQHYSYSLKGDENMGIIW